MRTVVALAALVTAVFTAGLLLQAQPTSADSVYTPTSTLRMCNAMPGSFADDTFGGDPSCSEVVTAGSASATTVTYAAPVGNVNLHSLVTFFPAGMTMPGGVAGDRLAGARLTTTVGIANATCSTALSLDFVLYNVDTASAPSHPLAAGSTDRFVDWRVGSTALPGDGGIVAGVDASHAGPTSRPLTNIPQYVLNAFAGATPVAVYGGLTNNGLGEWVPLYLVQFASGGLATAPGVYSKMNSSMGQPLVWVLGDPTTSVQSSSSPSDVCDTTNITTTLLGTTNPAAGTSFFLQYAASARDTDQDGYENAIDTCPMNPAPLENPRTGANDGDSDGIGDSCDTDLPTATGTDVDGDGFVNRQDNCPQVANSGAAQSDSSESAPAGDFGPRTDGIGNACDSGALVITQNGRCTYWGPEPPEVAPCTGTLPDLPTLSDTVANGRYHARTNAMPECFGGTDADDDGYCTTDDPYDSGACTTTTPNSCWFRHTLPIGATHPLLQMDTDGDTVTPDAGPVSNWSDAVETYLGTDPTKPCAHHTAANNEGPLDHWPLDMDDNRLVNGSDYLKFSTLLGAANGGNRAVNQGGEGDGTATAPATVQIPGMGFLRQTRFDLNYDGFLNAADLGRFNSYIADGACDGTGTPPVTLGGTFQQ